MIGAHPSTNSEILPCPFCGKDDLQVISRIGEDSGKEYARVVHCRDCHALGRSCYPIGWTESDLEAWSAWNDRAPRGAKDGAENFVGKLKDIHKALDKTLQELEWAYSTIDEKLKFGLPEEMAVYRRELRVKGVLLTSIETSKTLLEDLEKIKNLAWLEAFKSRNETT